MSLRYAILGFLSLQPMSGYDLKTKQFDTSVSHFWPANQAQVYRTLEQLEVDGHVVAQWEVQAERPNRREYAITESGIEALKGWLAESRPLPKDRFPFLVQLYFARHISKTALLRVLADQRRQHVQKLAQFQAIELPPAEDETMAQQIIFGGFTLEFGKRNEQMMIDWIDHVIAEVEAKVE